jgi:predicted kinase
MSTLHLTRGLPASGKTTFAKAWVAEDPEHRVRLNRDDIRAMVHTEHGGYLTERATTIVQHNAANGLLRKGYDIIVDDTNFTARFVKEWLKLAERQGATVEWHDQFLQVGLQECIDRDEVRAVRGGHSVGPKVIQSMHDRYLASGRLERPTVDGSADSAKPYTGTPGARKAVIVDIDGTLALNLGGRSPYDWQRVGEDSVNRPVADMVDMFQQAGYELILMSGRDEICREATEQWLFDNGILTDRLGWEVFPHLFMRAHEDNRKDSIVKLELFDLLVRDHFDVKYVIDDRNQVVAAWRSIGLTVLQVADGDF